MPIVIGAFGTVTKRLLKGLEDLEVGRQVETIQTTTLLRMTRILKRVLETCCHSNSSERTSANADVKNSNVMIIIMIITIVWFSLVSLFNGISTFIGYLMPKLFS